MHQGPGSKFEAAQAVDRGFWGTGTWTACGPKQNPAREHRRSDVARKITEFAIDLDGTATKAVMVNCRIFLPTYDATVGSCAYVDEDGILPWATGDCPISSQARRVVEDFVAGFE